jgi:rhodanese-related sulfurtransferase
LETKRQGSSIAASWLQRSGFDSVAELAGGIVGWEAAKLPVQTGQPPS